MISENGEVEGENKFQSKIVTLTCNHDKKKNSINYSITNQLHKENSSDPPMISKSLS